MKQIAAILVTVAGLLVWHADAHAACTTQTYFIDGRMVICLTCCHLGGNCTTTCN